MAKGKDLCVKCGSHPKERSKSGEQGGEGRGHRGGSLTGSAENINDFGADEILGKDRCGNSFSHTVGATFNFFLSPCSRLSGRG